MLHQFKQRVPQRGVTFLNARHEFTSRNKAKVNVSTGRDRATIVARKCYREHSALSSCSQGADDVVRIAAGGKPKGNVVAFTHRTNLPREDMFQTNIIGQGRYSRALGRKR